MWRQVAISDAKGAKGHDRAQRPHICALLRRGLLFIERQGRGAYRAQTVIALTQRQLLVRRRHLAIAHLALLIGTRDRWLAAIRAADVPFVVALDRRAALSLRALGRLFRLLEELVFRLGILSLCLAALPAVSPITHEELEAVRVDLHARLEADTEIPEVHLVLVGMSQ